MVDANNTSVVNPIYIGPGDFELESNVIRIGVVGSGGPHTKCYLGGIQATLTSPSGILVRDVNNQIGTLTYANSPFPLKTDFTAFTSAVATTYTPLSTHNAYVTSNNAALATTNNILNAWTNAVANQYLTKVEADGWFMPMAYVYTKTETDNKYPLKTDVYTKTESDNRYMLVGVGGYTKAEADSLFPLKTVTYTKSEVNAIIENLAPGGVITVDSYTKTQSDSRYYQKGVTNSIPYNMINDNNSDGVVFSNTLRFPWSAAPNLVRTGGSNDGIQNTILGVNCGTALTTGYSNVFVGRQAGVACTAGFQNVIIGRNAGGNDFANYNIAIGAGTNLTAGANYQIVMGYAQASMGAGTIKIGGGNYASGTYISGIRNYSSSDDLILTISSGERLGVRSLTSAVGALAYTKSYIDDTIYTKVGAATVFRSIADSYTKAECDTKYRTIAASYTNTQCDALFRTKVDSYSKTETDTLFSTRSETTSAISSLETSINNTLTTNYYTKTDSDVCYYTKTQTDIIAADQRKWVAHNIGQRVVPPSDTEANQNMVLGATYNLAGLTVASSKRALLPVGTGVNRQNLIVSCGDCHSWSASTSNSFAYTTSVGRTIMPNHSGVGTNNVCIGSSVLAAITTGSVTNNVIIGNDVLAKTTVGATVTDNIIIGKSTGPTSNSSNSLTNCIMIGAYQSTGLESASQANKIMIGNNAHTTLHIPAAKNTNISGSASWIYVNTTTGQIGTISSSQRYKENIVEISDEDVNAFDSLIPSKYNYKEDTQKELCYGFISEDADVKMPTVCLYKDSGSGSQPESVKYQHMISLLAASNKKLRGRVSDLENKNAELEARLARLEALLL